VVRSHSDILSHSPTTFNMREINGSKRLEPRPFNLPLSRMSNGISSCRGRSAEEDVTPIPGQPGLRMRGLMLAQDLIDAQLQQQLIEAEDHHALCNTDIQSSANPLNASSAETYAPSIPQVQPPAFPPTPSSRLFTSHPASSPFRNNGNQAARHINSIPSKPLRPSFSPIADTNSEPSLPLPSSNVTSGWNKESRPS
jgi:hypothetical protein